MVYPWLRSGPSRLSYTSKASISRWHPVAPILLVSIVGFLGSGCGALGGGGEEGPPVFGESVSPAWYASNEPLLTDYLDTLPDSAVGEPLTGILLSDGKRWLEGDTYLGKPDGLSEGVNVRLIDDGEKVIAYIWLDAGAVPLTLEPCTSGPQRGIRARRAGGGAFAWRAIQPDHGLLYTECPPAEWLPTDRPAASPPPKT